MTMIHLMLTREERLRSLEPLTDIERGRRFDYPAMACRTGDGHAQGSPDVRVVTCPDCLLWERLRVI